MGNSFIYSPNMDGYDDDDLVTEEYERSYEENEELGLTDMNTEGNYWERDVNDNKYTKQTAPEGSDALDTTVETDLVTKKENRGKDLFVESVAFEGARDGMVFKSGVLGLGYYVDNMYDDAAEDDGVD